MVTRKRVVVYLGVFFLIVFVNLIIITVASSDLVCRLNFSNGSNPSGTPRPIEQSPIQTTQLWSRELRISNSLEGIKQHGNMIIAANAACNEINAYDLSTGNLIWRNILSGPQTVEIDSANNQVYITGAWVWKRQIAAFNLANGETEWVNKSQYFQRGGISVDVLPDGGIFASGNVFDSSSDFFPVNPNTGELGQPTNFSNLQNRIYSVGGELFYEPTVQQFSLRNGETGSILWSINTPDGIGQGDILASEEVLIIQGANQLIAIELNSGERLWEYTQGEIISNLAIDDQQLYFLNIDAALISLELTTGKVVNTINFIPPAPEARRRTTGTGSIANSWVTINNDIVAIYFNDIETLNAFKIDG